MTPGIVWGGNFFTLDARFNNTIKYVGRLGGFALRASYSPGGVAGDWHTGTNLSVGASYQFRSLLLAAAYQKTYSATTDQWAKTAMGGATWQLGPTRLYLSYSTLAVSAASAAGSERRDNIPGVGIVYQITPTLQFTGATYYDMASNLKKRCRGGWPEDDFVRDARIFPVETVGTLCGVRPERLLGGLQEGSDERIGTEPASRRAHGERCIDRRHDAVLEILPMASRRMKRRDARASREKRHAGW
ncbi:hypothetical protein CSX04_04524 [Burkholderia cepacia]|nr:hypothetical protein CSX04_04524 [Burkholderia cepacia]